MEPALTNEELETLRPRMPLPGGGELSPDVDGTHPGMKWAIDPRTTAYAQLRKALWLEYERLRTYQKACNMHDNHAAWLAVGILATELHDELVAEGIEPWETTEASSSDE